MKTIKEGWESYLRSIQCSGTTLEQDMIECLRTSFYAGVLSMIQVGPREEVISELKEFLKETSLELEKSTN